MRCDERRLHHVHDQHLRRRHRQCNSPTRPVCRLQLLRQFRRRRQLRAPDDGACPSAHRARRSSGNSVIYSTPIPWAANYTGVRDALYKKGYTANEVYAITWWDGQQLFNETLTCAAAGQVRVAIAAIAAYTNHPKVNVIGYCLGNLLARKYILGGNCVDQVLNLGGPITSSVNHYISVGSPNYGSVFCNNGQFSSQPVCNTNNGVICGSNWLNDINNSTNPPGYEGTTVNSIYATNDQLLGDAPACTAASGTCPAPGSPQHTGSVCAQVGANALAPFAIDPHYTALVGSKSIGIQVSIVMS